MNFNVPPFCFCPLLLQCRSALHLLHRVDDAALCTEPVDKKTQ